jgi:hypothetical protein
MVVEQRLRRCDSNATPSFMYLTSLDSWPQTVALSWFLHLCLLILLIIFLDPTSSTTDILSKHFLLLCLVKNKL